MRVMDGLSNYERCAGEPIDCLIFAVHFSHSTNVAVELQKSDRLCVCHHVLPNYYLPLHQLRQPKGETIHFVPRTPAVEPCRTSELVGICWLALMRASAIPRPFAIDLNLQRPAQERSHEHDETKHANAGEGGINGDTADDIGNNQQF